MCPVIARKRAITGGQLEVANRALKTVAGQGTQVEERVLRGAEDGRLQVELEAVEEHRARWDCQGSPGQ